MTVLVLLALIDIPVSGQVFVEEGGLRGLALDGVKDGGFAFEDVNADGWLDVIVNTDQDDPAHRTRLYVSSGPPMWTFTDITNTHCQGCNRAVIADAAPERCIVFGDFNQDGYPDFVRNSARRLDLFLNKGPAPTDGNPPFSFGNSFQGPNASWTTLDITSSNPPNGIPFGMNTEGIGVFDFDQDGDLDLFIENHDWGMDIFENTGYASAVFVHATPNFASRGLPISASTGDYAAVTDINNDGLVDVLARKQDQLDFFLNLGGTFAPVGSFDQQANNDNKGGAAFHDFDNDGDFDLLWTENDSNRIWLQAGVNSGIFTPTEEPWASAGLVDPYDGSIHGIDGLACGDVDNDGDIDIFLADDTAASYLFINQLTETGSLGFVRDNRGIQVNGDAEGATLLDFDEDGDLDLYLNLADGPNQLWRSSVESSPSGEAFLVVQVLENRNAAGLSVSPERDALGATIRLLDCDGTPLSGIKEVNGGYGHGTQENRRVHFGLPLGANREYVVEIYYPSRGGARTVVRKQVVPSALGAGHLVQVRPDDADVPCNTPPVAAPDVVAGCPGDSLMLFPMANDFGGDGVLDPASFTILAGPSSGTVSYDPATGKLTYVSTAGGPDSLRYEICNDATPPGCAEAWIRFDVSGNLLLTAVIQNPFCAGFDDGAIGLGLSGGTSPYTYLWSTGDTTESLVGLMAGSYGVNVTDHLGCDLDTVFTLIDPPALVLSLDTSAVSAVGVCDGSASVSASGGTPPFTYLWMPGGETDSALTGLCAGAYTVQVIDANGCTSTLVAIINSPACALGVDILASDAVCAGEQSGTLTAAPFGGLPPYAYLWLPSGDTVPALDSLSAGSYSVIVTDAAGCTATASATVTEPLPLVLDLSIVPVSAPGADDGSASVVISGATPPYTVAWSNGDSGLAADSLSPGMYTVTVTDSVGCTASLPFSILDSTGCSLQVDLSSSDISCSGAFDGSATASITGGTAPYAISWSTGDTVSTLTGLGPGSYLVFVTDAAACSASASVVLTEPSPLSIASTIDPPVCNGDLGSVTLSLGGGTAPYTVSWSDGTTTPDRDSLAAGSYTALVIDANGCADSLDVLIPAGSSLDLSASIISPESCAGNNDGSAVAVASGGTAPYAYTWLFNGSVFPAQSGLTPGDYSVVVADAGGCVDTLVITVPAAMAISLSASLQNPFCSGDSTGQIDLAVAGGSPPFAFVWSNGATGEDLMDVPAGTYSVLLTDANACTAAATYTLTSTSTLGLSLLAVDPACGLDNGSIVATLNGASGMAEIVWSTGDTASLIGGLGPGFYTAIATDSICQVTASVVLASSDGPALSVTASPASCGSSDGSATVSAIGASPFSVLWSDGQVTPTATGLAAGSYTVLVTDSLGCAASANIVVPQTGGFTLSTAVIPPSSCGANNGLANVTVSGGSAPFSISWSNGDTGPLADSLATGVYVVTVTDAAGCSETANVLVADGFGLDLSAVINDAGCGSSDGSATISVGGGTAPYTYSWSTGDNTATVTDLAPGLYSVTVMDANGCSDIILFSISGSAGFTAVANVVSAGCSGDDGSISLLVSGAVAPLSISWSTGASGTSISDLIPGLYGVSITDGAGCNIMDSVLVGTDCAGPPLAVNDTVATHEGVFLVIDVLVNDTDSVSGGPGPPVILVGPSNGTAAVLPDSTIGYNPAPGFIGIDSLQYEICNADGCSQAWVIIYVGIGNNPPVALPDIATTPPATPVVIPIGDNDFDPDGDVLTWALVDAPAVGTAAVGSGTALYVPPPGFAGIVTFVYAICDPASLCDTTLVTVVVDGPGAGDPVAVDDFASTEAGEPKTIDILDNDIGGSFPLDPTSVTVTGGPDNGTVVIDPLTGEATYTPNPGFIGVDSFTYQVCNTAGFCDEATVVITVGSTNNPPTAVDDSATTPEDTPVWIPIFSNDSDPDGDLGLPVILTPPSQGSVVILPDGSVIYTPNPGYVGTDVFTYEVCDATGNCDDAVVIITVTGVNLPPLAEDDYGHTELGTPIVINLGDNDTDPDGDPLTFSVIGGPSSGSISLGPGGMLTYTPWADGVTDTVVYVICDPFGACDTAIAVITVGATDNPPVVQDDHTSTLACTLVVVEILLNDNEPDGQTLTPSITVDPAVGTAFITDDVKLVYLPPDGFTGVVTLAYEACDPDGNCSAATVTIHVLSTVLPPAAFDDFYSVPLDAVLGAEPLENDFDPNGHVLIGPDVVVPPINGSVVVNADGSITYTPAPGFVGLDSLQYAVCDTVLDCVGGPRCDTAWVYLVVFDPDPEPVDSNLAPVAVHDSTCTEAGMAITIPVLANDSDPDADLLTLAWVGTPASGTASANADGTVTYIPGAGFNEGDSFQYAICDPSGLCDTAWVFVCRDRGFFVPDVITPNGDGSNDFFVVDGLEDYPNNTFIVFNRWGDEVYQAEPYENDWRGTYRDRGDLPDGTYYFILTLGDGSKPIAGYVAIFR